MQYEMENVNCSKCGEHHEKVDVQHGFVFDFFHCNKCGENSRV